MYSSVLALLCALSLGGLLQIATSLPHADNVAVAPSLQRLLRQEGSTPIPPSKLADKAKITWIIDTDGKGTRAPLIDLEKSESIKVDIKSNDKTNTDVPSSTTPSLPDDVKDGAEILVTTTSTTSSPPLGVKITKEMEENAPSKLVDSELVKDAVILIETHGDLEQKALDSDSKEHSWGNDGAAVNAFVNKCSGVRCTPNPPGTECKEDPVHYPPPQMSGLSTDCCPIHYCRRDDGSTFYHYAIEVIDWPARSPTPPTERPYFVGSFDDNLRQNEKNRPSSLEQRSQGSPLVIPSFMDHLLSLFDPSPFLKQLALEVLTENPKSSSSSDKKSPLSSSSDEEFLFSSEPKEQTSFLSSSGGQAQSSTSLNDGGNFPPHFVGNFQPYFEGNFQPHFVGNFPSHSEGNFPPHVSTSLQIVVPSKSLQNKYSSPNPPKRTFSQKISQEAPVKNVDRVLRNSKNVGSQGLFPLLRFDNGPFGVDNLDTVTRERRDTLLAPMFGAPAAQPGSPFGFFPNLPGMFPFNGFPTMGG